MSETSIFVEDSTEENSYQSAKEGVSYRKISDEMSIVIDETDTEDESIDSEEEILRSKMKTRKSMRMSLHPRQSASDESEDESDDNVRGGGKPATEDISTDDDDDEDEKVERRAFSPVTRMSIHGRAAIESSEDDTYKEDDDSSNHSNWSDESDEEEVVVKPRRTTRKHIVSDEDSDHANDRKGHQKRSYISDASFDGTLPLSNVNGQGTPRHVEKRERLSTSDNESNERNSIKSQLSSTLKTDDERLERNAETDHSRGDMSFVGDENFTIARNSIVDKLSSTQIDHAPAEESLKPVAEKSGSSTESNSVKLVEKSLEILTVSSDDDDVIPMEMNPPSRRPVKTPPQHFIQPTITAFVRGQSGEERVSQSEYDGKVRRMADLKSQLVLLESMIKNSSALPDKGAGLVRRLAELKTQIFELAKSIEVTRATPSKDPKKTIRQNFDQSLKPHNSNNGDNQHILWDPIKNGTDDIQPRYTGKQGIATFENQKLLTLDSLATLHKSIETCPTEDTLAQPPKLLKIELMPHQRHALAWMLWREKQKPHGGILADDMGLGKTLSMISLILLAAELDPEGEVGLNSESEDEENQKPETRTWTTKGRKNYYAGGTLIVCPASLIRQWEGEITSKVKRNSLAVCVHHGTQRETKPRQLAKYDVIITTYNIVSREGKADSYNAIFGVNWERIILDEAHVIRNHKSAMSESCCALKGRCRWLLTGTPIQNKEMDVYALMKFLKCSPFDDLTHYKRWIDNKTAGGAQRLNTIMKSIMLRRTKTQLQQRGALTSLPEKTITLIEVQLEKDEMNVYQKVLLYSKSLFAQFLHQRAEKEQLTGVQFGNRVPTFAQHRAPNAAIDKVHQKLKRMNAARDGNEVQQHQILVLLLRLRQICCHPGLITQMLSDVEESSLDISESGEGSFGTDVDLLGQLDKLKLNDVMANGKNENEDDSAEEKALLNLSKEFNQPEAMSKAISKVMLKSNPVFSLDRRSSKIEKMLQLLEEKILQTDDKAIVVSQWTSMLELLESHLSKRNVRYVSLTGKVPVKFRNDIVVDFNNPKGKSKIMLLSLMAGGVGLNLVGANHLFLLDLHWNPQLEAQAQDRVFRVGQQKPVFIWKFMCLETVEQKIHQMQQHKLGIADGVLTGTVNQGSKLTIDDLKSIFGL